jgi:predicted ester cyclase
MLILFHLKTLNLEIMKQLFAFIVILAVVTSCNGNNGTSSSTTSMDSTSATNNKLEKNKAAALNCVQSFSNGSVEGTIKDCAQDMVDYGDGSMPPSKGLDSIKAGIKSMIDAFPDFKGSNFMVLSDDANHIAVLADWTGTFKNTFMGMKPTGKSFKIKDVDLFTFNDAGKIIEHRNIMPFSNLLEQVGAKMSQK